jgi:nicotinamide-nucleotide amidase
VEVLSVGTELTVGDTRDTNAGEIAGWLAQRGVEVSRLVALPDVLETVRSAFEDALRRVDLVVSTGGLGPTRDDLTREAVAALSDETPVVDQELETWLRELWSRRDLPFVDANLKQAWLIPSAVAIPNPNGTAPGWWVDRDDGRVIVILPGPPREMRPMWQEWVLPRLIERGLGREVEVRTLRTSGIGESLVVDRLGDALMNRPNPIVTTYARQDAVDIRIAALPEQSSGSRRTAVEVADEAEAIVVERLGEHVWGRDRATWTDVIDGLLVPRRWRFATAETGTGGTLAALLAGSTALRRATMIADPGDLPGRHAEPAAEQTRRDAGVEVGVAVVAHNRGDDMTVTVALVTPVGSHRERRIVFLGGAQGRQRAAVAAAAILHASLVHFAGMSADEAPAEPDTAVETEVPR